MLSSLELTKQEKKMDAKNVKIVLRDSFFYKIGCGEIKVSYLT